MSIKVKIFTVMFAAALAGNQANQSFAQSAKPDNAKVEKLKLAVEANPNDIKAISAYMEEYNTANPGHEKELANQFQAWVRQFPKSPYLPVFSQRATKAAARTTDKKVLARLKSAIEAAPDSMSRHVAYIEAVGPDNPELAERYEVLMKEFPHSVTVPYALAKNYIDQESPKAKPYLLKAVAINPKFAPAWADLWMDAQRWGDFDQGWKYMEKAIAADPTNVDYAFNYAASYMGLDQDKFTALSLKLAKDFPKSDKAVRALGYLATRSAIPEKIKYYGMIHDSFPPEQAAGYMTSYFDVLLPSDPQKAESLATEMKGIKQVDSRTNWGDLAAQAKMYGQVKDLLARHQAEEALAVVSKIKLPRYYPESSKNVFVLKAEAIGQTGRHAAAYDTLMKAFIKEPSPLVQKALYSFGAQSGKNEAAVKADIYKNLDAKAKPATPFTLKKYIGEGSTSLADYKGKVMLLTYWFPGCGPCRGEMPFFENVVKQYKDKPLAYVGINISPEQDEYVIPFHNHSGFSFTPLADVKGRDKGNLDNRGQAPMNFLIDQNGRIVFSDFSIHAENEENLKMMVDLLLSAPSEFTKNKL